MNPIFVAHAVYMFDWEGKGFIMLILGQFVIEAISFVLADIRMTLLVHADAWVPPVDLSLRTNKHDVPRLKRSASSASEALAPISIRDEIIWSLYAGLDWSLGCSILATYTPHPPLASPLHTFRTSPLKFHPLKHQYNICSLLDSFTHFA